MLRRRILLVIALFLIPLYNFGGQSIDSLFIKANKEYAQKNFEAAIKSYQQLLNAGTRSSSIYYNLGNAHYRSNNYALAILNYERAHRIAPNDKDINANLVFLNSKITDKMEVLPELFLKRWWNSFLLLLSIQSWSIFGVSLLLLGFAGLIVYLYNKDVLLKRISFYSGITSIFLGLCFVCFAGAEESYLLSRKEAIVFNGTLNVKSAPDPKQKTLSMIHEGTKVSILVSKNGWFQVELPNGNIGWVEAAGVELI